MAVAGYAFGPFRLDVEAWRLTRDGEPVVAQDKVLVLLGALVERPGLLWSREELYARLWPGIYVSDDALFQVVRKARKALGDDPREPRWIETVQGRGYRFLGEVRPLVAAASEAPVAAAPPAMTPAPQEEAIARAAPSGVRCRAPDIEVVGREEELAAIAAHFAAGARLVTLLGPGGAGKTTLALAYAASGDARFVDLDDARSADDVAHALGEGLGADSGGPGAVEAAFRSLPTGLDALVVLDNAELCVRPLGGVLRDWVVRAPHVRFLVTSRRPLELAAERVVSVGPLAGHVAARLFAARAEARGFALGAAPGELVEAVVDAVDRLPLALELAASRVGLLGLEGLLDRLRDPLLVLRANRADLPERHRSIRAALELSWAALDDEARIFLAGACVFRAPFLVDDAETVVTGPDWRGAFAMDLAQAVVDASLVRVVEMSGARRLAPYVAVRELALELGDPVRILAVRHRHLDWLAGFSADLLLAEEPAPRRYARLVPLVEDGIQAMRFGLEFGRRVDAARVAVWLAPVLGRRGAGIRARELLEQLGPLDGLPAELEVALLAARARLTARSTSPEAAPALFAAAADRAASHGLARAEAAVLLSWADATIGRNLSATRTVLARAAGAVQGSGDAGHVAYFRGLSANVRYFDGERASAERDTRAALDALSALDRGWWAAQMLLALAEYAYLDNRYADAEKSLADALSLYEQAQAATAMDLARTFLAMIRQAVGRLEEALAILRDVQARARRMGDAQRLQHLTYSIGGVLGMMGRLDEATAAFRESLQLARQHNNVIHEGWVLLRIAGSAWRLGQMDEAEAALHDAIEVFERAGRAEMREAARIELARVALMRGEPERAQGLLVEARERLKPLDRPNWIALAEAMWGEARAVLGDASVLETVDAAVEALRTRWPMEGHARGLASAGIARLAAGDRAGAIARLEQAEAIRAEVGDVEGDIARDVRRLREAIG